VAGYAAPPEPQRPAPAPERHLDVEHPGQLVQLDCFCIGRLSGTKGTVWQYTAIDVASASTWATLQVTRRNPNGWQMNTDTMGVCGNFYLKRAIVVMVGLGANQPEDAIYPLNVADADGAPLDGDHDYLLRFDRDELPRWGRSGR
jgi:hypothetical protein